VTREATHDHARHMRWGTRAVQPHAPVRCLADVEGFGMASNAASMGMCSKCYREHEAEEAKVSKQAASVAVAVIASNVASPPPPPPADTVMEEAVSEACSTAPPSPAPAPSPSTAPPALSIASPAAAAAAPVEEAPPPPERPVQTNPSRCFSCNKRVGLTGFKCRCEFVFCSTHRYSDKHDCEYDYKAVARDMITKANPTVIADKVQRVSPSPPHLQTPHWSKLKLS
jgi:hypothetical protein